MITLSLQGAKRRDNLVADRPALLVYIVTNARHTVRYTGVTNNLSRRLCEHRAKLVPGFTSRYDVSKLVFDGAGTDARDWSAREQQIKAG